jgi:hypothetical protein
LYCLGSVRLSGTNPSQPRIYQYRDVLSLCQPLERIILGF